MNRWIRWRLLVGVVMCGLFGCKTVPSPPPNVLVILTDDQGYGDLSCHGNPVLKTPHLDRFAAQSIRLTDFHVAPVCTPTRSQLLTGMDAMRNGAFAWAYTRHLIRTDVKTMADHFAANGYATGHFGKWHLGDHYPHRPHDRGFDETIYHGGAGITQTPDYWNNDYFDDHYRHRDTIEQYPGYCTDVWFDQAKAFMKKCRTQGKPFMVYLPTNAPHAPLYVPDRYRDRYRNRPDLPATYFGSVASCFGMIANIDENMGKLESFLQSQGLRDNTVVIWMTDNGATAGVRVFNAGMRGHKGQLYDGGHRVPCFIRWPGGNLREPGELGQVTVVQDVLPTLVELCGLRLDKDTTFDGVSLAPMLRGREQNLADRMHVVQHATAPQATKGRGAVLWKTWRLIVHTGELYDIAADPGQANNIADQHPQIVDKMKAHYEKWWAGTQPTRDLVPHVVVGDDHENPVEICCFDWYERQGRGNVTIQPPIREGIEVTGLWNIEVARSGRYRITLRRWPLAADAPITASVPEYKGVDATFPAGMALPIAAARLKVGEHDLIRPLGATDKGAVFEVDLNKGRTQLATFFMDADQRVLCSAYYVQVEWVAAPGNRW